MRNFANIFPLKSTFSGKFQRFKYRSMSIDGSMSVEQNFSDEYLKKHTNLCFQNSSRMQFLGVQEWCSANVFSDTKQKHVC